MYPVDTVAAVQGAHDARSSKHISDALHDKVVSMFYSVSKPGPVGRMECDYKEVLCLLATLDGFPYYELSRLWESLGVSLASGIGVGDNCHACVERMPVRPSPSQSKPSRSSSRRPKARTCPRPKGRGVRGAS